MQNEPVLTINDLRFHFHLEHKTVRAVNGVSYHLNVGKTLGLVGESGSGKSVCALSILRLNECPPGEVVSWRNSI